jgi:hypothetical protein
MTVNQPVEFDVVIVLAERIDKNLSHFKPADVETKLKQTETLNNITPLKQSGNNLYHRLETGNNAAFCVGGFYTTVAATTRSRGAALTVTYLQVRLRHGTEMYLLICSYFTSK